MCSGAGQGGFREDDVGRGHLGGVVGERFVTVSCAGLQHAWTCQNSTNC